MKHLFSKLLNNRWVYYRKAFIFQAAPKNNVQQKESNNLWVSIFPASMQQIEKLKGYEHLPKLWKEQFIDRLASENYQLFLIRSDNRLVYFSWIAHCNEPDLYLNFKSHSVSKEPYLFHCYTLSEFRGKGLHQYATTYLINHYLKKNQSLWGIVYGDNKPAIKAWEKAGMRRIGKVNSYGLFNVKKTKYFVDN